MDFSCEFENKDNKIIFQPQSENFIDEINKIIWRLNFESFDLPKNKEHLFLFSKILKHDFFDTKRTLKSVAFSQKFQIASQKLHQKIYNDYKNIHFFCKNVSELPNFELFIESKNCLINYDFCLNFILKFLNFRKNFMNFFDHLKCDFFLLDKKGAFLKIFSKNNQDFTQILKFLFPNFMQNHQISLKSELKIFEASYNNTFNLSVFKIRKKIEDVYNDLVAKTDLIKEISDLLKEQEITISKNLSELFNEYFLIKTNISIMFTKFDDFIEINLNNLHEKVNLNIKEKTGLLQCFDKNLREKFLKFDGSFLVNFEKLFNELKTEELYLKNLEADVSQFAKIHSDLITTIPNSKKDSFYGINSLIKETWILLDKIIEFYDKLSDSFQNLNRILISDFLKLKLDEVVLTVNENQILCNKLIQNEEYSIFQSILQKVINELSTLSLKIKKFDFINQTFLNDHYINSIFEVIGVDKKCNLQEILKISLEEKNQEIEKIEKLAKEEFSFKSKLEKIEGEWERKKIDLQGNKLSLPIVSNLKMYILECKQDIKQIALFSENILHFSKEFQYYANFIKEKFFQIFQNLKKWKIFQKKCFDIDKYIDVAIICQINFKEINSLFYELKLINDPQNDNSFLFYLLNSKLFEIFEKIDIAHQNLKIKIKETLQTYRISFPRFLFLNDNDLINFLLVFSNNDSKNLIIPSIFPGVFRLAIDSEEKIIGMLSFKEELFKFETTIEKNPLSLIDFLNEVEEEMKKSFKSAISDSINLFPLHPLDEWIFDSPNQIIVSSLHMIVSHEIYEMYKVSNFNVKPQEDESNDNEDEDENQSKAIEKVDSLILQEKKIILNKQIKNEGVYSLKFKQEIEEMFGKNVDNEILGKDKMENIELLQEKSFRGLLLRLQFWVNQLANFLHHFREMKEQDKPNGLKKLKDIENVVMFIIYLRDCVNEMYHKMGSQHIEDFEFKKHLKILMEPETNNLIAECGG